MYRNFFLVCRARRRSLTAVLLPLLLLAWPAAAGAQAPARHELVMEIPHAAAINSVAISPDGARFVTASSDGTLQIWDTGSRRMLRVLAGHSGGSGVSDAAFSADGELIVSAGGSDRQLIVWQVRTGRLVRRLEGHGCRIRAVAYSRDGKTIASGGDDGIRIWEAATGVLVRTIDTGRDSKTAVSALAFSPRGDLILAGAQDHTVRL